MFKLSSSLYTAYTNLETDERYVALGFLVVGVISGLFLAWQALRGLGHVIGWICKPLRRKPQPAVNPNRGIYAHLAWPNRDEPLHTPRPEVDGRPPVSQPGR
jgi:hypothetical protein